jgi:outer membrane protein assembly factor BamB
MSRPAYALALTLALASGASCADAARPAASHTAPPLLDLAPREDTRPALVDAGPPAPPAGASAAAAPAPAAAPRCPATPWAMYAHDAQRTSASDGCIEGPLTVAWKITRKGTCGFRFRPGRFMQVIGDDEALFASVDCGDSPAVMRVSPAGEPGWTFSRGDYGRGGWPALAGGAILSTDDGVYLAVGDKYFVDNTFQLDGAGPFLGAFDATLKWTWRVAGIIPGKGKAIQRTNGTAFADGLVVRAAAMGARFVPSLTAHDAQTGERRWLAQGTWPESAPAIADGRVYCLERWKNEERDRLVARALGDGSLAWSAPVPWARGPSPVIAGKIVAVHTVEGVRAFDRQSGALAWSHAAPRKAAVDETATTLAAATGSGTLVVLSGGRLVVLGLGDGAEQWSGAIVTGRSPATLAELTLERPSIIGRSLYFTSDGALYRLDSKASGE